MALTFSRSVARCGTSPGHGCRVVRIETRRVEPSDLESRGLRIEIQRVVSSVIGSRNLRTEIRRVGRIMELALCS